MKIAIKQINNFETYDKNGKGIVSNNSQGYWVKENYDKYNIDMKFIKRICLNA